MSSIFIRFCSSIYEVRQLLNSKQILVNNKTIQSNYVVKKGDVVSFSPHVVIKKLTFEKLAIFELFSLLSPSDFESVMFDSVQLKMFIDYIKTK